MKLRDADRAALESDLRAEYPKWGARGWTFPPRFFQKMPDGDRLELVVSRRGQEVVIESVESVEFEDGRTAPWSFTIAP